MGANNIPGLVAPDDGDQLIRRIEALESQQRSMLASVSQLTGSLQQRVVSVTGDTDTSSAFALSSGAWVTVATVDLPGPAWATNAVVTAAGSLYVVANAAFAVPSLRIQIEGTGSLEVELPEGTGASAIPYYGTQTFTLSLPDIDATVTCNLQAYVLDSSKWHAGAANRKAQLSVTAVFAQE